jgi:hypothetical protein
MQTRQGKIQTYVRPQLLDRFGMHAHLKAW